MSFQSPCPLSIAEARVLPGHLLPCRTAFRPVVASHREEDAGADVYEELGVDLWEDPERWDGFA